MLVAKNFLERAVIDHHALSETICRWAYLAGFMTCFFGFPTNHRVSKADEPTAEPLIINSTTSLLGTNESKAAYRRFNQPAAFIWQNRELRPAVTELAAMLGISVWIDREVDPSQLVSYPPEDGSTGNASNQSASHRRTLLEALEVIADSIGAEAGLVESVLLISPKRKCARTQLSAIRLHSELHQSYPKLVAAGQPFKWQELATSNELLQNVAKQFRTKVLAELPHDLYHAGQLANCSLATQLTLVASGFEQEFYVAGRNQIRLRPLNNVDTFEINYAANQLSPEALTSLQRKWPTCNVKSSASGTLVVGLTDCHVDIWGIIADKDRAGNVASGRDLESNNVWTFRIENIPVEQVLSVLSANIGFDLQWSNDCTAEMRAKLISVSVESAPLNALLDAVCNAANLKYSREGNTVNVRSGQ